MTVIDGHKQKKTSSKMFALYHHRELLWAWTMRTIRSRYKQSLLGGFWAVIQPAAKALMLTVIFTRFVPIVDTGDTPYLIFSYTAMVPWTLLSAGLADMVSSMVTNMGLVGKIYFPREILPIASLLARMLDFLIAGILLIIFMAYYKLPILTTGWLYLPLILGIQCALMLGLGLAGAALNVFYRDITHLFAFGIQLWFYATPIIYPVTKVPDDFLQIYHILNPMAGIIESYRSVLLYQEPPSPYLWISAVIAIPGLFIGYWLFKKLEFQFADVV